MTAFEWALIGYLIGVGFVYFLSHNVGWLFQQAQNNPRAMAAAQNFSRGVGADFHVPIGSEIAAIDASDRSVSGTGGPMLEATRRYQRINRWGMVALVGTTVAGAAIWFGFFRLSIRQRSQTLADLDEDAPPMRNWGRHAIILWALGIAAFAWGLPRPGYPQSMESYIPLAVASIFILPWAWLRIGALVFKEQSTPRSEVYLAAIFPLLFQIKITVGYICHALL